MKKFLFFMLMMAVGIAAQAFTMKGQVRTESNEPLPFVSVYLKDIKIGSTTDLDGRYELKDVPAGKHTLVVSYVGYETQIFEFNMEEKNGAKDFVMKEQAITLDEVFITPTGESFERFLLSQTVKNTKKLKQRVASFECNVVTHFEQRDNNANVAVEPYRKTVGFAMGILGFKNFFFSIVDNPSLKLEMVHNIQYSKGAAKHVGSKMTYCTPQLKDEEVKSWLKLFADITDDYYDNTYEALANIKKNLEKMDKKKPGESEKIFKYGGAYNEDGRIIHILKYGKNEYHIVDGLWQVRRIYTVSKKSGNKNREFCELSKGIYMPVSNYKEFVFNLSKIMKEELDDLKKMNTEKMKADKLAEHNKRIADLEEAVKKELPPSKLSSSINYKNFKAL